MTLTVLNVDLHVLMAYLRRPIIESDETIVYINNLFDIYSLQKYYLLM